jgi:hypothetical protein
MSFMLVVLEDGLVREQDSAEATGNPILVDLTSVS